MKKSKFTEAQIAFAIKQAETGTRVEEVCRKMGISEATFYNWKKKCGGLGVAELRRLRQLEEENAQMKKLVADLSLDKRMLPDVLKKNTDTCPAWKDGQGSCVGLPGLPSACVSGVPAEHLGLVL